MKNHQNLLELFLFHRQLLSIDCRGYKNVHFTVSCAINSLFHLNVDLSRRLEDGRKSFTIKTVKNPNDDLSDWDLLRNFQKAVDFY